MEQKKKIAIVGMGALGILYGDMITRKLGKDAVVFLADEKRVAAYETEGVFCNGKPCDFQMVSRTEPVDLLIFAVKGTTLQMAMELAECAVGDETVILSLLNGISSEEMLEAYYDKGTVIHCIAQGMDAVKLGNKLTYAHAGELRIGTPDQARKPQLEKTVVLLQEAEIPYVVEEDICHRLWGKWMLNVGVNQVVMVTEGTYRTIQQPGEARDMMIAAMEEVRMLSEKEGTGVTVKDLESYAALVDTLNPDGMPSMRQDGLARRYSEVDFFAGTVIEKAKKYGLSVPVNEMLYEKVKKIEAGYIKNIILDMGNVLLSYDPQVPLDLYAESDEAKELIRKELFEGPEWIQKDLGNISDQEMYEGVKARLAEEMHPQLLRCVEGWDICMEPVEGAKAFCDLAKEKGYKLYVLSNASERFYKYFPRLVSLDYFDGSVVSCDVHMIKPDPGIYQCILEKYGLNPGECLFIDDREENVAGAEAAGMQGYLFKNDYQAIIKKYYLSSESRKNSATSYNDSNCR